MPREQNKKLGMEAKSIMISNRPGPFWTLNKSAIKIKKYTEQHLEPLSMAGIFLMLAELAIVAYDVSSVIGQPTKGDQVAVSVLIGDAAAAEGSQPRVSSWNDKGELIVKKASTFSEILTAPKGMDPPQPAYVSVIMSENDGVCISAVIASGNSQTWSWSGDMGYMCGAQWSYSRFSFGGSNAAPRCVWIDKDGTNKIIAKGISLHMRDFTTDKGLLAQYLDSKERVRRSSARMTFLTGDVKPDMTPPFFSPPLEYHMGDADEAKGVPPGKDAAGAIKEPDQGIDRQMDAYPDGTTVEISSYYRHRFARGLYPRNVTLPLNETLGTNSTDSFGSKNIKPGHLNISDIPGQSAIELCQAHNSLGADFVSTLEGKFCDMETSKVRDLCSEEVADNCFHLDSKSMRQSRKRGDEKVPDKKYDSADHWDQEINIGR
ncbi:Hypothetical protein D9617_9g026270 [Elsinoe fawcettii]|nr:Hypothetical protein D9617_9g026270 [Elsinoe fawcettii]